MDWNTLAAISEAISAFAVVVTLVFLIRQLNQNTRAIHSSLVSLMAEQSSSFASAIHDSPDNARIWRVGNESPDELAEDEMTKYRALMFQIAKGQEALFLQYRSGVCSEELWQSVSRTISRDCRSPGFKVFWDRASISFTDSFASMVEERMRHLADA